MLDQRLLTALILVLLVLAAIFYLPDQGFLLASSLLILAASWEWCGLIGWDQFGHRILYGLVCLILLFLAYHCSLSLILLLGLLWWLLAVILVVSYPNSAVLWNGKSFVVAIIGLLIMVPAWRAINVVRQADNGTWQILYLLILVSVADSAAYFSGRRFGRHRLLPQVSPGKTWEGVIGAAIAILVLSLLLSTLSARFAIMVTIGRTILLSLLVLVATIIGDLAESMFKRARGIKDSGYLLPGHGGLLDRIDGLLAAAPIFLLLSLLLR